MSLVLTVLLLLSAPSVGGAPSFGTAPVPGPPVGNGNHSIFSSGANDNDVGGIAWKLPERRRRKGRSVGPHGSAMSTQHHGQANSGTDILFKVQITD